MAQETGAQIDDEVKQLVKEGHHIAAFKLLQSRRRQHPQPSRASFDELLDDLSALRRAGMSFTAVVVLFFGWMLVIGLVIVGLTFVGLGVSEWTLFPALDQLLAVVMPLVFAPGVLPVIAVVVLVIGLPQARKFRSPATFVTGLVATSLGLVCFWLFPWYMRFVRQRFPAEAELPLLIVGGVISLLLFVGGMQLMAQANG